MADEILALRLRAIELGIKNVSELSIAELKQKVAIMEKVMAEGLKRIEFEERKDETDTSTRLQPTTAMENIDIFSKPSADLLTKQQVLEKLVGYRILQDNSRTTPRRWTRYIDFKDGILRTGGFPIKNTGEFIVFKNVSKKFTFSVRNENIILFEKVPDKDQNPLNFFNKFTRDLVNKHKAKPIGINYIAVRDDLVDGIKTARSVKSLADLMEGVSRKSLGLAFKEYPARFKFKNWWIFRLSDADEETLTLDITNARTFIRSLGMEIRVQPTANQEVVDMINQLELTHPQAFA